MNKKKLLIILLLLMTPIAMAFPMCESTKEINTNCTMLTPAMNCSVYNYTVINSTGSLMQNEHLTLLYDNLYYLNFTLGKGDYIVKLCDDTTREIRVKAEDSGKMIIGMTILLPLILTIIFLVGAATLGQEHSALKIALFLLSIIPFFVAAHFATIGIIEFYEMTELQEAISGTVYWVGLMLFVIISYFMIYAFTIMIHMIAEKKKQRFDY